jgi:hypothetical protein
MLAGEAKEKTATLIYLTCRGAIVVVKGTEN